MAPRIVLHLGRFAVRRLEATGLRQKQGYESDEADPDSIPKPVASGEILLLPDALSLHGVPMLSWYERHLTFAVSSCVPRLGWFAGKYGPLVGSTSIKPGYWSAPLIIWR